MPKQGEWCVIAPKRAAPERKDRSSDRASRLPMTNQIVGGDGLPGEIEVGPVVRRRIDLQHVGDDGTSEVHDLRRRRREFSP